MDVLGFNPFSILLSSSAAILGAFGNRFIRTLKPNDGSEPTARDRSVVYDTAFSTVSNFFLKATNHTVEEMQKVGNAFIPSPPYVRVSRAVIPAETCAEAQKVICQVFGEDIDTLIGGSKWWTKRTISLSGEWISLKKDERAFKAEEEDEIKDDDAEIEEERMRKLKSKAKEQTRGASPTNVEDEPKEVEETGEYPAELDEMSCTLAIHGGAYLFGSINTHRYCFWRIARKTSGRVFAVSYRLSPQYPFPCALDDALSAYLFLIRPPPGAAHRAVHPSKVTILGDSAGGGLALALLCLIRDSGLPAPAGGVLISPWVDLTHSFPSILQNTSTDYVPPYGFLFKPSVLWPPPSPEFTKQANQPFTVSPTRSKSLFGKGKDGANSIITASIGTDKAEPAEVIELMVDGKMVKLSDQIQLYATNKQLTSPWVSPIWQPSLGGLPPLYILAGNDEVLRDEVVYMAHRAANPAKYPLRAGLLPTSPKRIELAAQQDLLPTQVHLQIYDLVPHDLYLFSFLKPAKYAYRTISSFINSVTASESPSTPLEAKSEAPSTPTDGNDSIPSTTDTSSTETSTPIEKSTEKLPSPIEKPILTRRPSSLKRVTSTSSFSKVFTFDTSNAPPVPKLPKNLEKTIYSNHVAHKRDYSNYMIRERVSWDGIVRAMEGEEEMNCLNLEKEELGLIKSDAVARYLEGSTSLKKRFAGITRKIQQQREHHLLRSRQEELARVAKGLEKENVLPSVDLSAHLEGESPPPSALVARFDTREARKLAKVLEETHGSRGTLHAWTALQDLK